MSAVLISILPVAGCAAACTVVRFSTSGWILRGTRPDVNLDVVRAKLAGGREEVFEVVFEVDIGSAVVFLWSEELCSELLGGVDRLCLSEVSRFFKATVFDGSNVANSSVFFE